MRRITRNQRIKDIEPECERGPMEFKPHPLGGYEIFTQHLPRGDTDHDPMFRCSDADHRPQPRSVWVNGLDPLPASPTPATPEPPLELLPEPPEQHNDHVMNYWNWRLDRLEAKRHG